MKSVEKSNDRKKDDQKRSAARNEILTEKMIIPLEFVLRKTFYSKTRVLKLFQS